MRRVFFDMDGPTVDFDRLKTERGVTGDVLKKTPGAYLAMEPTAGALKAIREIEAMGYEGWFASKPPTGQPQAYAEKVSWIMDRAPEYVERIILTHDKGLLGDAGDYLVDDRPHKANASKFRGTLLVFSETFGWAQVLETLKAHRAMWDTRIKP